MREILPVCIVNLIRVYKHCPTKDRNNRMLGIVMSNVDDIFKKNMIYDIYIYVTFFHILITFFHILSRSCIFITHSFIFFWLCIVSFYIWLYVLYAFV